MMRRISNPTELRLIPTLMAVMLAFALSTMGCASKNEPVEDTSEPMNSEFSDGAGSGSGADDASSRLSASDITVPPIYFDLDSSEIKAQYEGILQGAAVALDESGATVVVEGHCDERGSEEYNFALGERRAGAVRRYLYNLGVPMAQMSIVSYGEARPAVNGSGESAWRLNRRAQFQVR